MGVGVSGGVTGVRGWWLFTTADVWGGGVMVGPDGGCLLQEMFMGEGGYWCEGMVVVCYRGCSAWGRCVCGGGGVLV